MKNQVHFPRLPDLMCLMMLHFHTGTPIFHIISSTHASHDFSWYFPEVQKVKAGTGLM